MDTKHTPGPWVAREYDGRIYIDTIEGLFRPGYMATGVLSFDARGNEANARLIAAAPELLEALIDMVESVGAADPGVYDLDQARAAIAKATTPNT